MKDKKFNKNIIVFIICSVFIIAGALKPVGVIVYKFIKGEISTGNAVSTVNDVMNKRMIYQTQMVELNGLKENLLGIKVVKKEGAVIVRTETDSLVSPSGTEISEEEISEVVDEIDKLRKISNEGGAEFLYCAVPAKENFYDNVQGMKNCSKQNYQTFLKCMSEYDIPFIDCTKVMEKIDTDDIFYRTDHHWRARTAFNVTGYICEQLNQKYDFSYNHDYTDISNYNIKTYKNLFLGSKGKKVGALFTDHGADDFELITPQFETDMTESQPFKNEERTGKFEDTVIFKKNLKKDYYNVNTYVTYSGGNYRLQIMKNNLNKDGKKILLIRDSFACALGPFMSLQTSELHMCDMRNYEYYVGDKINVKEYIEKIKPDYVLVIYSGIQPLEKANGKYDFF